MGCMFRSDFMSFCDIFLQPDTAFNIITQIGRMGCVEFIDMTPNLKPYARKYITEICRCAEMERKLLYMEAELIKENIHIDELENEPDALQFKDMSPMENVLERWNDEISDMAESQAALLKNYLELSEMYYVVEHIGPLLGDSDFKEQQAVLSRSAAGDAIFGGRLYFISGVVRRTRCYPFEVMLWRISRGNMYYKRAAQDAILKEPQTGQEIRKVAFLAVCQGEQLNTRMEKVCAGFRVNIYSCPQDPNERHDMLSQLRIRINDLEQVIKKTRYHRCIVLRTVAKQWESWMVQIKKSKAVFYTMNRFSLDITKKCLIGQCWIPDEDIPKVTKTLEAASYNAGTNVPSFISKAETFDQPPTYHRTNKYTQGFQALINAYGDSTYRELNPGLYTLATFPFLFAVMFGDFCHGVLLVSFSGWMVANEKKYMNKISRSEIWNILFGGRYVILAMGLFTLFTGFMYNVFFSKSIILTPPYWINNFYRGHVKAMKTLSYDPASESKPTYLFGVDPVWALAKNKIMFLNSLKMKLSIIIGTVHMIFGLLLSFLNHIYFKRYYAITLQCIPQVVFLCCLFLWLVIMIYMKWIMYSAKSANVKRRENCAPSLLILFIDMVLMSTSKPIEEDCDAYIFAGQESFQRCLLIIAAICVPIILFGTPLYLLRYYKKKKEDALKKGSQFRRYQRRDSDKREEQIKEEVAKYSVSFGELMIHQSVFTIEFVLSTISHTASYLRLWALSLAHDQLSEMLWVMVFAKLALMDTTLMGSLKIIIVFAIWASFSLSILVLMEGLSAFLHTLRLHWVEFMSKFYGGTGRPFEPFSFKEILSEEPGDKPEAICAKLTRTKT